MERIKEAFSETPLDHFNHGPHDYRGYLGEYPRCWPYTHRSEEPLTFSGEDCGISFQYPALRQLRGGEWEYDYSHVDGSKTLLMPSVTLVQAGNLQWDHCGGWLDDDGEIQIQDPWWWTENPAALICRLDYMDRYLANKDWALIILGYQSKYIAGLMDGPGLKSERTLFIRIQGKTKFIKRHLMDD